MPKCQNCGRWTAITDDLLCPYCKQPIVSKGQEKTLRLHKQLLNRLDNTMNMLDRIGREPKKSTRERGALKVNVLSLIYLFVFAYLEYVTYFMSATIGLIFNFVILIILIINGSVIPVKEHQNFLIALGLFPLIIIVSLTVPMARIPQIYWYFIISTLIIVSIIGITKYLIYSLSDIGLNLRKPLIQLAIALVGIGLGIVDYIILKPEPLIDTLNVQTVILPAFILIIATGFTEEIVFRGVLQRASYVLGSWGWVYVAAIYTITQIGHKSLYHIIYAFLVSILFGWVVKKTGSILGTSISHGLLNVGLYLVLPHIELEAAFMYII